MAKAHANAVAIYKNAIYDYEKAKEMKSKVPYTSSIHMIDNMMDGLQTSLANASKSVEKFDSSKTLANGATQLGRILREKVQNMRRFHLEVLDLVCTDGEVDEGRKKVLQTSVKAFDDKQEQMEEQINGLVKELTKF